ncbi:zinc ribbon domain-containing protein [Chengkuizengella sediminis]|uniref:zinc ribbon domain-containing protein n=1 Tax=Chengkuizengella sediminis TaxID=1885917 RepID=UPI001389461C|nr:zinc ribbon domain-containing protein [Chengkuizengella sediminis]NDI36543.1 zinc-ribbon domain-containing protein [Chengkuizengella sediminis]
MNKKTFIIEEHKQTRKILRVIGPIILFAGVISIVIAMVDFFTLEGFEQPKYFWLMFVGLPLIFVGLVISGLGYGSAVARYQSREYTPVVSDTFNHLSKQSSDGIRNISKAIREGASQETDSQTKSLQCSKCGMVNEKDAKFCKNCAQSLQLTCLKCGALNESNAKFCDQCGERV